MRRRRGTCLRLGRLTSGRLAMRTLICAVALLLAACSSRRAPIPASDASGQPSTGSPVTETVNAAGSESEAGAVGQAVLPEPGPENGGLRLRLTVTPRTNPLQD